MKKIFLLSVILLVATSVSAKHYPDSVRQAGAQEPNIKYGWNFEFSGGLGVSSYTYKQIGSSFASPHVSNKVSFPAGNVAIGINYYFASFMGLGTGVEFSNYANRAVMSKPWTETTYDDPSDPQPWNLYTITSTPQKLSEAQQLYMLEIPVALKFRARPGTLGFTGTAGVKLGIPMYNRYRLADGGSFMNKVYYEYFDLLMEDVPGVIEDVNIAGAAGSLPMHASASSAYPSLRTLNYAAYLELGMLIHLQQRVDLNISAYATYYINDVMSGHNSRALGFATGTNKAGEYTMPYTTAYQGVLRTNEVESLHPWNAGIKLGIQINANRTKAQRDYDRQQRELRKRQREEARRLKAEQAAEEERRKLERAEEEAAVPVIVVAIDSVPEIAEDTVPVIEEPDPREVAIALIKQIAVENGIDICKEFCEIHDTVYLYRDPEPTPVIKEDTVAKQLDDMLKKAVIFFDLDKAIPILEPEDILIQIAEIMKRHPDQKIHVNGHACILGKPDYNKRLAMRRAKAVAEQLKALGVRDEQMIIASLGDDVPYRYQGQHQLSKDRRVEIVPTYRTTEIVRPGSRLAQIARRHYGNPEYWVFIYEANRDQIVNPADLTPGIELEIPNLTERLKGMNETQAMEEAKRLKEAIMNK